MQNIRLPSGFGRILTIFLSLLLSLISLFYPGTQAPSYALEETDSPPGFVENLFPVAGRISELDPFTIQLETLFPGVTDQPGRGEGINCNIYGGPVDRFGGTWLDPKTYPMTYDGDIGDRDQYSLTVTPVVGLYEYTANCVDSTNGTIVWHSNGNGQLEVYRDRQALWVDRDTIAWNHFGEQTYELHYSPEGELIIPQTVGSGIELSFNRKLKLGEYPKLPNLENYDAFTLPRQVRAQIPEILKSEIAIAAYDRNGYLRDVSRIQTQGVLDDLYNYPGELGVVYNEGRPTLKLWAPTARSIVLHRFADANPETPATPHPMTFDSQTGVWSIEGDSSWDKQYYLYEVEVFVPDTRQLETNLVTDPYAVNLSQNSQRSQILDLYSDPTLKPEGWDTLEKPPLAAPEDITIYEVHVRDFSRDDLTVLPEHRGTFKAFTYDSEQGRPGLSDGMSHLVNLADAGLTHIHLLPAFDITGINEDASERQDPDPDRLAQFSRNSNQQQALVTETQDVDSFNWGYNPFHYGVPEGSYTTNPNDTSRVREFREMVQTLAGNGLRVVLDCVYNHAAASGQYDDSVLDRIVPGYYFRYDNNGYMQTSSCCSDTAVEFDMMQKLMIDTVLRWATAYRVDGFRFDLMNLHTVASMEALRDAVRALTPENHGVDGSSIYLYGEGWSFGSARDKYALAQQKFGADREFLHADQFNLAGTGIGTFNDKIRDAVHGGGGNKTQQGFINGLAYDWNGYEYPKRFQNDLRFTSDRLRVALAGNLQNYRLVNQAEELVSGRQLAYTGYALDPQETVNYISKHDNETLYDLNIYKLPLGHNGMAVTSMADRVRSQNLGLSLVGLAQGIPFFHLGSDMLRSKSLDRNSYNSGDWFNRVDFTYRTNNFGVGLPLASENRQRWTFMSPFLANPDLDPDRADIESSVEHLKEILQIRRSSKLFRLESESAIKQRVSFHNTGLGQKDALIAMSLRDDVGTDLDPDREGLIVFFNANKFGQELTLADFVGKSMRLHPVQGNSHDRVVKTATFEPSSGTFSIPARTTAVFEW